jgi:hypothetical protein
MALDRFPPAAARAQIAATANPRPAVFDADLAHQSGQQIVQVLCLACGPAIEQCVEVGGSPVSCAPGRLLAASGEPDGAGPCVGARSASDEVGGVLAGAEMSGAGLGEAEGFVVGHA